MHEIPSQVDVQCFRVPRTEISINISGRKWLAHYDYVPPMEREGFSVRIEMMVQDESLTHESRCIGRNNYPLYVPKRVNEHRRTLKP